MTMAANEIFRKLTCGAIFKKPIKTEKQVNTKVEIKEENIEASGSEQHDIAQTKNDGKSKIKVFSEEKQKMLHQENINHIRNKHHINVVEANPPDPVETFGQLQSEYQISNQLIDNLIGCGYNSPTAIQMQAIPIMTNGNSVIGCAPTGSGKTAAFLVPIIKHLGKPKNLGFRALILCPTRELAKQLQRECLRLVEGIGLRVHTLSKINKAEELYGAKSTKRYDILITTPKRVCYLLEQNSLDLSNVQWIILDEADKLFEEGKNSFREQFDSIYGACSKDDKKVGIFSATCTGSIVKWARTNLKKIFTVFVGPQNTAAEFVKQELLFVGDESGKLIHFRNLLKSGLTPPVLVFTDSKDRAQQLYSELIYDEVNVDIIHSDRTQKERDNVIKRFREGKVWILICSELMGRGIDFKGINLVVNYDFPPSAISYIHRIGRTGRAGHEGKAITYFTRDDKPRLKSIVNIMRNSGCEVPEYMLALKKRSKKVRKMLEKKNPERANISTIKSKDIGKNKRKRTFTGSGDQKKTFSKKVKKNE